MINFEYNFGKYSQEILYGIDNWINKGSGWMVELLDAAYVNITIFIQLSAGCYTELSNKFKGLINLTNNGNKCFLWCHI